MGDAGMAVPNLLSLITHHNILLNAELSNQNNDRQRPTAAQLFLAGQGEHRA